MPEEQRNNEEVRALLAVKSDGKILPTIRNMETVMQNDSRIAGKIRFDEFSNQIYLFGSTPWETRQNYRPWTGYDDSELLSLLQYEYDLKNRNDFFDALNNVSHRNSFHQVRSFLESLPPWDGKPRTEEYFIDFLGAEDCHYTRTITRMMTDGAIRRIYEPGCKFDVTVVLQGAQGCGKSTAIRLLAMNDNWFSDSLDSLDSNAAVQVLQGSWIFELSELKSLSRTSSRESVKRFLTATSDKVRLPYQRRPEIFMRQCIFIGSTNQENFVDDLSGGRRFFPIRCGVNEPTRDLFSIDTVEYIRQMWAEALERYRNKKPSLTVPPELLQEVETRQANIMVDDGRRGQIEEYLSDSKIERTCSLDIWLHCFHNTGNPKKYESAEINSIIASLPEWEKTEKPIRFDKEIGVQRGFKKKRIVTETRFEPYTDDTEEYEPLPFN
jgi:predicted P-loop ATPase